MTLRLGLLSTARINDAVLGAADATGSTEVVAVASRDAATASAYARRHGIATAHSGYRALLDDPGVDAVYVSVPNSLHVEWTRRAIEAGKHVLCEKPFSWSGDEAARAVAAAERAGVVLAEAFMYRHHPQTRALADLVAGGAIGRPQRVRARFAFTAELPQDAVVFDRALCGGALLDVGCYCVSISRLLAGEPISATAECVMGPTGVDLRVQASLRFAGEVGAEFAAALDLPDDVGVEVVGSAGTATLADPWRCLRPGIELGDGGAVAVASGDPYRLQLDDFAASVREGRPALVSGAEIVGQARTLEALIESARHGGGAPVDVATAVV